MCIQIHILLDLQRHEGVDVSRQECKSIVGVQRFQVREFIRGSTALESKGLKHLERRVRRQAVQVHDAGLLDHMVGVVILIDRHSNPVRCVGHLGNRIHDQAVILLAVVGGDHI